MSRLYSFGFYNLENLFDTVEDPNTFDDDFTPYGRRKWTIHRYENKIGKLGKAIASIGKRKIGYSPSLLAVAEVENKTVLKDLLQISHLRDLPLDFIHFDSKDERGIDVALIFNHQDFQLEESYAIHPPEFIENGIQDFTRDVLYTKGKLAGIQIHIFVVHLPSRRNQNINLEKRNAIATLIRHHCSQILYDDPQAKIMIFGDFNSNPEDETIKKYFKTTGYFQNQEPYEFYNPMELMRKEGKYTTKHRDTWILYDQMLFSKGFYLDEKIRLISSHIFNPYFLQEWNRKYHGEPFRTYVGRKYLGGYSDHFPIYTIFKI